MMLRSQAGCCCGVLEGSEVAKTKSCARLGMHEKAMLEVLRLRVGGWIRTGAGDREAGNTYACVGMASSRGLFRC